MGHHAVKQFPVAGLKAKEPYPLGGRHMVCHLKGQSRLSVRRVAAENNKITWLCIKLPVQSVNGPRQILFSALMPVKKTGQRIFHGNNLNARLLDGHLVGLF